jgi:3-methylcrotonyl-CoA carboxylase alpha subunit
MPQTIKVIVNGKPFVVEVGARSPHTGSMPVKVDGRSYQVSAEWIEGELPQGQPLMEERHALKPEGARSTEDQTGDAEPDARRTGTTSVGVITAPMPGNISNIAVEAGEVVGKDQVLCTLEAMKMQNAIRSPRDGVIAGVNVRAGQAVAYGDVLFVFA